MPPLADPRPFSEVLRDWMARHQMTGYAAAHALDIGSQTKLANWLAGRPATHERALRALMTLIDEGRG